MNKLLLGLLAAGCLATAFAEEKLSDYRPGRSPDAKNVAFKLEDGVLTVAFGAGNGLKSFASLSRYYPLLATGDRLRITVMARTENMNDPRARLRLLVQAMGENNRYLASQNYLKDFPAEGFAGEWKPMEFIFTMPDVKKARKWDQGKVLMITMQTLAAAGTAQYKDLKMEPLPPESGK